MTAPTPEPTPTPPTPPAPPAPAPAPPAPPAGDPKEQTDDQGRGLGFPAETPVERMTDAQASAYWRNQSRTQERERREWQTTFGTKTAAEVKAALDAAATAAMSEQEKAIEAARKEGIEEGQKVGVGTSSADTAMLLLESYLEHRERDVSRRKTLVEFADLSKVVGEDGKVDAAKVKTIAEALAPNDGKSGDQSRQRRTSTDVGAGRRGGQSGTGVAAGRDLFAERHGKAAKQDDE